MKMNYQSVKVTIKNIFYLNVNIFLLITIILYLERRKMSLIEERANYLRVSLEEKRLKREETANYRATKLQILKEIKDTFQKQK